MSQFSLCRSIPASLLPTPADTAPLVQRGDLLPVDAEQLSAGASKEEAIQLELASAEPDRTRRSCSGELFDWQRGG